MATLFFSFFFFLYTMASYWPTRRQEKTKNEKKKNASCLPYCTFISCWAHWDWNSIFTSSSKCSKPLTWWHVTFLAKINCLMHNMTWGKGICMYLPYLLLQTQYFYIALPCPPHQRSRCATISCFHCMHYVLSLKIPKT